MAVKKRGLGRGLDALLGGINTGSCLTCGDLYLCRSGFEKAARHIGTQSPRTSRDYANFIVHGKQRIEHHSLQVTVNISRDADC